MFSNFKCFPITRKFFKEGINRCYEPVNLLEKNHCFGPPERDCIDCYLCFIPITIVFDTISCCICQFISKNDPISKYKSNHNSIMIISEI